MDSIFNINKITSIEHSLEQKPNILLAQFSVIAIFGAIIQIITDLIYFNFTAMAMDAVMLLIFLIAYVLNEKRKHLLAKFIFIFFGTGFIFIYAAIVPKSVGAYLVFFPMIAILFLVFNNEEKQYKYLAIVFVMSLLMILEITNYQPFGQINVTEGKSEASSFYINMLTSFIVLIYSMYHMDKLNKDIDQMRQKTLFELEEKNKALELANEELDHFVYSASHDLKAPLSSILGLINIAKYEVKDKQLLDYFDRIENRVDRLTKFIKEVIEISRNTRTDVKPEKVSLNQIVDEVIENNNYLEGIEEIRVTKEIDIKESILIDRARLEVILNNLISNAMKYGDHRKQQQQIKIAAYMKKNKLLIEVADNGIGIPLEQQKKVFEMFYRGVQDKEGSGLGLYIVKNMVKKLGGNLKLYSVPGEGTTVAITLPYKTIKS